MLMKWEVMIKNDESNYIGIGCHVPARYIWERVSRADTIYLDRMPRAGMIYMGSGATSRHDILGSGVTFRHGNIKGKYIKMT